MYIKLTNNTPESYSIAQLRRDNPEVSFPPILSTELMQTYDVFEVVRVDQPVYDSAIYRIEESAPIQVNNTWTQSWNIVELTSSELLALNEAKVQEIRAARDNILIQTVDKINAVRWDSMTESKKQEWSVYRQALLDITIQPNFPLEVVWPNKPE